MINFRNRLNSRSIALRVGLCSAASVIALAFGTGESLAQQQSPPGNSATSAKDGSPTVVAQLQSTPTPVPNVTVTAPKKKSRSVASKKRSPQTNTGATQPAPATQAVDGSAAQGYRAENVTVGQLGNRSILDTPFSVNVVSSDVIKNAQVDNLESIAKYLPSVTLADYGGGGAGPAGGEGRFGTRGFVSAVFQNTRLDGMIAWITPLAPEGYQRLEVLNGLTGSIYGTANPSGTFNLVQKRPTETTNTEMTGLYRLDAIGEGYVDYNTGDLGNGVRVRFTGLYEDGNGWVQDSLFGREFESLAADWHINPQTTIETNFTHSDFLERGFAGNFYYSQNAKGQATVAIPQPIDPTLKAYGQDSVTSKVQDDTITARLKRDLNNDWSFNVAGLYQYVSVFGPSLYHTLTDNAGDYTTGMTQPPVVGYVAGSNIASINGRFLALGIQHQTVIGTNGYYIQSNYLYNAPSVTLGPSNINNPTVYPSFSFPQGNGPTFPGTFQWGQNLVLSDTITFNRYWQIMLTGNEGWIDQISKQTAFSSPGSYAANGFSPTASLIFKPVENITTYFTYANSLQQGDVAPATAANALQPLAPYRSQELEAGIKARAGGVDVGADVFRINRPYANVDANNVFRDIGNQVDEGVELFSSGRIARDLSIFGGVTFINPKLEDTGIATTNGQDVVGVPRVQANMLFEYDVPDVKGLTLGTNVHYTGRRAADDANTQYIGSYTTVDLSARYVTKIEGHETIYRLNVNNVTNTRYWASILPADLTGGATGTYHLTPGTPLDVLASVTIKF